MAEEDPEKPKRASRNVKLVLMGVGGAALLYSCTPAVGSAIGAWPGLWFIGNPFYRGPVVPNCGPTVPGAPACTPGQSSSSSGGYFRGGSSNSSSSSSASSSSSGSSSSATTTTSSRGGFGSSAGTHGSGSS